MTKDQIKEELRLVRYGYNCECITSERFKANTPFRVELVELAKKYDDLISSCLKSSLSEVYHKIYHEGFTQEAAAEKLFRSKRHVERLHKELIEYFITKLEGVQPT